MCVCDKRGDTVRWWDIRTKPVLPHQLTQYCTKRYTSTSTHSTLHKKIHYPHINPHKAAQKDTLLHQLTEHYTKRYTTPTSTHTILHKKIHCPDQLTLYTKRKTAHTCSHQLTQSCTYGSHHWSPQTTLQTFIDFDFIHDDVMIVRNTKHVTLLSTYTL